MMVERSCALAIGRWTEVEWSEERPKCRWCKQAGAPACTVLMWVRGARRSGREPTGIVEERVSSSGPLLASFRVRRVRRMWGTNGEIHERFGGSVAQMTVEPSLRHMILDCTTLGATKGSWKCEMDEPGREVQEQLAVILLIRAVMFAKRVIEMKLSATRMYSVDSKSGEAQVRSPDQRMSERRKASRQ